MEIGVRITDTLGSTFDATLKDASEEGFAIRTVLSHEFVREALYTMKVVGLEPRTAYLIWSCNDRAGFVLSKPLSSAIVQALVLKSMHARFISRLLN